MRMQDSLNNYPMYQITIISIKRRGGQYPPLFYGFFITKDKIKLNLENNHEHEK